MTTSYDVARLAGVSQSTVSRAFRENGKIDPATREKVMEAAKALGYYPNSAARDLKNGETNIIGLLMPDINNTFYSAVTKEIESNLGELGYKLMITFSDANAEKERLSLETLISSRVAGIVYVPTSAKNADIVKNAEATGISVLQFTNKLIEGTPSYMIDDEYGGYTAAKYIFNMNHDRVLIFESSYNEKYSAKAEGFLRAAREAGGSIEGNVVFCDTKKDLVSQIIVALTNYRPTAVISTNVILTIAVLRACRRIGYSVPDDINMVAYDDSEWLDFMHIDVVAHPIKEIGREVTDMLMSLIRGTATSADVMTRPYLIVRNSVKIRK